MSVTQAPLIGDIILLDKFPHPSNITQIVGMHVW